MRRAKHRAVLVESLKQTKANTFTLANEFEKKNRVKNESKVKSANQLEENSSQIKSVSSSSLKQDVGVRRVILSKG